MGPVNAPLTPQPFPVMNGNPDLAIHSAPSTNGGLDCVKIEFTREDIETLFNKKIKAKNKFDLKEKCDLMMEYIKRLRDCIKWFQLLEGNYVLKQEKIKNLIESVEKQCIDMEMLMKGKEEELNSIVIELRKNNSSLVEKFAREESDKLAIIDSFTREKEVRVAAEVLQASLSEELKRIQQDSFTTNQKIQSLNDMYKRLQEYNTSLQQYNSKLQSELAVTNETLKRVEKEKADVMENLSTLKGHYTTLQDQIISSKGTHDEAIKQKNALMNEVECLRGDLQQARTDRDRQSSRVQDLIAEAAKVKETTEKSITQLDCLSTRSINLEATSLSQTKQIEKLQEQVAAAEWKLQMSNMSAFETRAIFEEQKKFVGQLQRRLADAELKIIDGDKQRKELYNTILELKGNIRVYCRVQPSLCCDTKDVVTDSVSYPTSLEYAGRGIDLMQNGQKYSFTFDRVFMPNATQEDIYGEVSQLVQSVLNGYKACIFSYGQTGCGKTYTMMGNQETADQKGVMPRALQHIFESQQALRLQGWKYEMQVSMLEIYNEIIHDLLATNVSRTENGVARKHHTIKHDANGNTHVSELTIIDVCSSEVVSFLIDQAEQIRPVRKTQMSEESSKSHLVFILRVFGYNEETNQQVQGVLNLVDLAGSECLSKSGSTGDQVKASHVNKSLASLVDVIFALAKKEGHVPFRSSKLTHLLQPCLSGDAKTLMFVNISPHPSSSSETLSSLRFAAKVNTCEIGIPRPQISTRF